MAKKKPNKKPSKTLLAYRAERKRISSAKSALKKMGFTFSDDLIPKIVKNPKRADVKELKKITREFLYSKATSYVTKEGIVLTPQEGREQRKRQAYNLRVRQTAKFNIERRAKSKRLETSPYELNERLGEELYYQWHKILNSQGWRAALDFERSMTDNEHNFFEIERRRVENETEGYYDEKQDFGVESGRDAGQSVLPDEGTESESEAEDETAYYSDEEREDAFETERHEKQQDDEKFRKWQERYKEQMNKPKKQRDYASEGEVVYAGIKDRLSQFRSDLQDEKFANRQYVSYNEGRANSLERLLENQIKIEGFNVVMRRLSGRGQEIDEAMQTMLYDSKEYKVEAAFNQLATIITGRALTPQESLYLSSLGEAQNYSEEDEDIEE